MLQCPDFITAKFPIAILIVSRTKGVIQVIHQGQEYTRAHTGADAIDCHCVHRNEKQCNAHSYCDISIGAAHHNQST